MRIKAFAHLVANESIPYELKNTPVVIDGNNFFYNMYQESHLPFAFGCDCDKYAKYLKEKLNVFKKANIECYIFFKGGCLDITKKFSKSYTIEEYHPLKNSVMFVHPTFAKNVCEEVTREMGFNVVNCPLEVKHDCIFLAHKLGCPVISFDIEYAFSNITYIPQSGSKFEQTNSCSKFNIENIFTKFKLDAAKLAIFIALTDTSEYSSENEFMAFFNKLCFPLNPHYRNIRLLEWLSANKRNTAINIISNGLNKDDRKKILLRIKKAATYFEEKKESLAARSLLCKERVVIKNNDPEWFEKGIVNRFVPKPYADMYYSNVFICNETIHDTNSLNDYFLSRDIIMYAYSLLKNYTDEKLTFRYSNGELIFCVDTKILAFPKPEYEAVISVFENGWDSIRGLRLFDHFLKGTLNGIDLSLLEAIPADVRLLMIALTYFTMKKTNETLDEIYSILLSYIMLGIVFENQEHDTISKNDFESAIDATKKYFEISVTELETIFDIKMIHPLVEFQHCLEQMNYLNVLCGSPYKPTVYSKTYNGTFVYKLLHTLKANRKDIVDNVFTSAPTVFLYLQILVESLENLVGTVEI